MPLILRVCVAVEPGPPASPSSAPSPSFGHGSPASETAHATAPAAAAALPSRSSKLKAAPGDSSAAHHSPFGRLFKKTAPSASAAAGKGTAGSSKRPSPSAGTARELCLEIPVPQPPPARSAVGTGGAPKSHEPQSGPGQEHSQPPALSQSGTPPATDAPPPPAKDALRHRSLAWLSVQVTPATSIKAVVQQVQDAVQRRMNARICTAESGSSHSGCSGSGHDVHAKPRSSSGAAAVAAAAGATGGASTALESPANAAASSGTAHAKEELCLCLADKHGVYHWLGGTRHFPKSAVLRAPFITEVCLRSHADFEEQRRERRREARAHRAAQRGTARRTPSSSSSAGGSTSSAGNSSSLLSVLDGAAGDAQEGSGPGHDKRGGRKRKGRKATGGDAGPSARAFAGAATATAAASPGHPKFAFLHGVVLPVAVLRQHNPHLTAPSKHHPQGDRTPRQYAEVRVPPELKTDPLDPSPESHVAPAAAAAAVHATPAEAPGPVSLPVRSASAASASHGPPGSEGAATADDAAATASPTTPPSAPPPPAVAAAPAAAPASTGDLSNSFSALSGSSASTLPSRTLHADDARAEQHHDDGGYPAPSPRPHADRGASAGSRSDAAQVTVHTAPAAAPDASIATEAQASVAALRAQGLSDAQACAVLAGGEAAARRALAQAQAEYAAALAEYRAMVPPAPGDVDAATAPGPAQDAEWTALVQRKLELQRELDTYRKAERQCERLTTLAECLEKELHDRTERRVLLAGLRRDGGDAGVPVGGA